MITVVRKDSPITQGVVRIYIGRPSPLGNPIKIGVHGTRDYVIQRYRQWLPKQELDSAAARAEMKNILYSAKRGNVELACHCKPFDCHGDVIKERIEYLLSQEDA